MLQTLEETLNRKPHLQEMRVLTDVLTQLDDAMFHGDSFTLAGDLSVRET